ncbi:alpha/beta fold hydrolase [Glaciimonas sp. PCH181]|uniref:alpha/beta fold hydrolase n=1 Tax=Glaciimonas sp. PCH181 TaxID=2133943 RepID=UPI000D39A266|nr:alpha/beta fold hydrolase [Glaciimonas sp. PCH181]PUA16342.1 prolyl aminopeptidase [Glaciimonas sp. PCH181]
MTSSPFFPLHSPFDEGYLDVGQGHRLWFAQYGNPDGIPLLWLHGGPGSGSSLRHQIFVDPSGYRLVLCDQRGCGLSTPNGAIVDNDTTLLVQDIETLRLHLKLGKILLGGGSWGACLALAYVQKNGPDALLGLILRAPFLAGQNDINRFFQPDAAAENAAWQTFSAHAPKAERSHLLKYLANEFSAASSNVATLAQAWKYYEQRQEQPDAIADITPNPAETQKLIARYRVQSHYLINHCFVCADDLLQAAAKLSGLPVALLQGGNDRICDPDNAVRLHTQIAGSGLRIVAGAGHDPFHPQMAVGLLEALNCFVEDGNFARW